MFLKKEEVLRIKDGDEVIIDNVRFCFRKPDTKNEHVRVSASSSPQYGNAEGNLQQDVVTNKVKMETGEVNAGAYCGYG